MTFDQLTVAAVAVTRRMAARIASTALGSVAEVAEAALAAERVRPPNDCPLTDAKKLVPDETHPDTALLVEAFQSGLDDLAWFRNDAVPSDFVTQSAAAELIGPDGALPSDTLRFGFFLIAPDTEYVRHWHAAVEHYMVLAGSAVFTLDAGSNRHGAGEVVSIPSMAPHAITTDDAGVLILYSWTGDITFDTYGY